MPRHFLGAFLGQAPSDHFNFFMTLGFSGITWGLLPKRIVNGHLVPVPEMPINIDSKEKKDMFENEMKLEFVSKAKNEAFARVTVAAFASQLDPTIEELADIKTAVSEAVTNCIIHGYENKQGIVKIVGHLKEDEIILEISDQGKGIENIEIAKEPLYTTKPNLERSGMGFTIMESFMDTMDIESIVGLGTKVTMSKKIKPKQEKEEEDFQMITKD